ncbi:MAG: glycoside hydrolase family 25 protein [Lachnospiraceae bacterium]|nr:glycoside hydrolase family 25 protein [Lachnospiraceae bacterium]
MKYGKLAKTVTAFALLITLAFVEAHPAYATTVDYYDPGYARFNGVFVNNWGVPIEGALKRGMDVSMYQGDIDWNLVAGDDIQFVFLRTGSLMSGVDPCFQKNIAGATKAGIPVGLYIKSYATDTELARLEAEFCVSCAMQGYPVTYPIVIDIEGDSLAALSNDQLLANINAFCEVVSSYGYKPMVYASKSWFQTKLSGVKYQKWVAQYSDVNDYTNNRKFWQATSHGHVNGVEGRVDIDFEY